MFHPESNPLAPKSSGPKKPEKELVRVWLGDAAAAEMDEREPETGDEGLKTENLTLSKEETQVVESLHLSNRALAKAKEYASRDTDPRDHILASIDFAKALAEVGRNPMRVFEQARKQVSEGFAPGGVYHSTYGRNWYELVLSLAKAAIEIDRLETAQDIAKDLYGADEVEFYSALGVALAKRGQDPTATFHRAERGMLLETEENPIDPMQKFTSYVELASAITEAGLDSGHAFAEAEKHMECWDSYQLAKLGAAKMEAGLDGRDNLEEAIRMSDNVPLEDDGSIDNVAIEGLVGYSIERMTKVGLTEMALQNMWRVVGHGRKNTAYSQIVEAQARAGLLEEARETIRNITDNADLSRALSAVAKAESKADLDPNETLAQAERLVEETASMTGRELALEGLVDALIELGRFQEASKAIERMEYSLDKSKNFSRLGVAAYRAAHKI